jgi:hypothetical protein
MRTEVLQGSKDGCLIGYVDIERLSTGVAYLRERLGGARGACDRPAVAQQALNDSETEIPRADDQSSRHQIRPTVSAGTGPPKYGVVCPAL